MCEAICSWTFVCWKIFDYSFDFHACGRSVKIFYFFQVVYFIDIQLPVVVSYDSLYFCSVSCNFSFLIYSFIDLNPLPLFLDVSGYRFIHFVYLIKNKLIISSIFAIVFFISISFISSLVFVISFLLLTLGFVCSFTVCFRFKVRLLL